MDGARLHRAPRLSWVAPLVLVAASCNPGPADDDTTSDAPTCEPGFVQAHDLPEEFGEEYPDGCVPEECGAGRWGDLEVDGDTVCVDFAAPGGGDGSAESPFDIIQDGLDAAGGAGGGLIAVAAGTYVENLLLTGDHDGVHLAGRCRELVVLDGSEGEEDESGIRANGAGFGTEEWTLSGVTVTGAPYSGLLQWYGQLNVASVDLIRNVSAGVTVIGNGSLLFMDDVGVRDSLPESAGTFGRGIEVYSGARLEATSCVVEGNSDIGIGAFDEGTEVVLQGVEVRDTQLSPAEGWGRGINVHGGARLAASSVVVEGNAAVGVFADGEETEVTLQQVEVRDTRPLADGTFGLGIYVQEGARLEASSCVVEGNAETGVRAFGAGTAVVLRNVEVRDTHPWPDGRIGRGVGVLDGAYLEVSSCVVEGNADVGIFASGEGTEAVLQGVEVRDTQPRPDGTYGRGISVQEGAVMEAEACVVEGNAEIGIYAAHAETVLWLVESVISGTVRAWGEDSTVAFGLVCQGGANVNASGISVTGTEGPGMFVTSEGRLSCEECTLEGNAFAGSVGWNGFLELIDAVVTGNASDDELGGGVGIYTSNRWGTSTLILRDSEVTAHPLAAVWLDSGWPFDDNSSSLTGNTLSGGGGQTLSPAVQVHGDAVFATGTSAWDGERGLLLESNTFRDSTGAGVFLDGSSAQLLDNTYIGNAVDLWQQGCEGVPLPVGLEEAALVELCPEYDRITAPLEFHLFLEEEPPSKSMDRQLELPVVRSRLSPPPSIQ